MDPFTQRMIQRAQARREQLKANLDNIEAPEPKKQCSPLKEGNSSKKSERSLEPASANTESTHIVVVSVSQKKNNIDESEKENLCKSNSLKSSDAMPSSGKSKVSKTIQSKLQKLAALYTDSDAGSSSAESHLLDDDFVPAKHAKLEDLEFGPSKPQPPERIAKFKALASRINQWEDFSSSQKTVSPPTKVQNIGSPVRSNAIKNQNTTSPWKSNEVAVNKVAASSQPVSNKTLTASPQKTFTTRKDKIQSENPPVCRSEVKLELKGETTIAAGNVTNSPSRNFPLRSTNQSNKSVTHSASSASPRAQDDAKNSSPRKGRISNLVPTNKMKVSQSNSQPKNSPKKMTTSSMIRARALELLPSTAELDSSTCETSPLPGQESPSKGRLYPLLPKEETSPTKEQIFAKHQGRKISTGTEDTESLQEMECDFGDLTTNQDEMECSENLQGTNSEKNNPVIRQLSESESAVFSEIDDYLNEALKDESMSDDGPTPPKSRKEDISPLKKTYASYTNSEASSVTSEGYSSTDTPVRCPEVPSYGPDNEITLMHSLSTYRRQQSQNIPTPLKPKIQQSPSEGNSEPKSSEDIAKKIKAYHQEVLVQQTIISQTSKAINICYSSNACHGSTQEVEGERLLLLATLKRKALLSEIERLSSEMTAKNNESPENIPERGSLTVSELTLPLKKTYLEQIHKDEFVHHFIFVVTYQEQVIATPTMCTAYKIHQGMITFPGQIQLKNLCSDFKIKLDVYSFQTRKTGGAFDTKSKKDTVKRHLTPKRLLKHDYGTPVIESPAGPSAVRSPGFMLGGAIILSLSQLQFKQWTLERVMYSSPLQGYLYMKLKPHIDVHLDARGFLTLFEDVAGFGDWKRRWFVLSGHKLSYWQYPEEEKIKDPLGFIDLKICCTKIVAPVSRDICARANTLLLETSRKPCPGDSASLVMVIKPTCTIIRHLLSADTREERVEWCVALNKALTTLRTWGTCPQSSQD